MQKHPVIFSAAVMAAIGLAAGCGSSGSDESDSLPVVATTSIVADIVENVGGSDVEVTTLVGRGVDAHVFEPEPADSTAIAEAAVVFEVGRGFEEWLSDAAEAAGGDAEIVTLSEDIESVEAEGEEAHSEGEEAHEHSGEDPHVWMTADNGVVMVESVADALVRADPDNAEAYRERAASYSAELQATGDEIETTLAVVPPEQRVLFTNHDAFGYFAAEHGFEVLGSALSSVTTEGADPSAADVAAIVREIEEAGVRAIFPENVANADTLETIARETGVEVGPTLATGALGEEGSDAETYVGLLQSNAEIIATSLGSS